MGWRAINSTYGVTRLVSFGEEPQPVPLGLISQLMRRCDESGKLPPPPILRPGDAVKITGGPFAEFVATVEKISPDRRVWVLLDLMGRTARMAVPVSGSLDVIMNDDQHRVRKDNAPINFAALRRIALNIIKTNTDKGSNRLKFKRAGWNNDFLRSLLNDF